MCAAATALLLPCSAHSQVRAGSAPDELAPAPPSLSPVELAPEVATSSASYDPAAGAVTVNITFRPAVAYGEIWAQLRTNCDQAQAGVSPGDDDAPALTIRAWPSDSATATLDGFAGTADGTSTVSPDGKTATITVSHLLFKNQDWRCLTGEAPFDDAAGHGAGDVFGFYFTGWEPLQLTATAARQAAGDYLTRRFGITLAAHDWLKCPASALQRDDEDGPATSGECWYDVRDGAKWRFGILGITVDDRRYAVKPYTAARYSKRLAQCPARSLPDEDRYVNGVRITNRRARAQAGDCPAPRTVNMIDDIGPIIAQRYPRPLRRWTAGWHGTGTASFPEKTVYPCRVHSTAGNGARHYRFTCHNKLGDRFTYSFDASRR